MLFIGLSPPVALATCALHTPLALRTSVATPCKRYKRTLKSHLCAPQCPPCLCGEVPPSNQMTACLGQACALHDHSTFPHKGRLPAVCVDAPRTKNIGASTRGRGTYSDAGLSAQSNAFLDRLGHPQ